MGNSISERLQSAPFIIAEMSGNHNHSLERAMQIVKAAAESGAHAIKLQTYTADTITMKGAYTINDEKSLWNGRDLYDLYTEAHTPWEWHKPLFDYAGKLGLVIFSSPFDITAVDFLEELGNPIYKIASFENTDHILLKKVAQTGKPVIMSTGVSSLEDIQEALHVLRNNGCLDITLLKCTSTYPASPENTNLKTILDMRERFGCSVGLSDHTMGIGVSIAAVAFGACVIEKHFTLNRADGGVDSAFSMEPHELKELVEECERAHLAIGKISYELSEGEKKSTLFKRSLYAAMDIQAGEKFTPENVRSIRPSLGLHTRYFEQLMGLQASNLIKAGTPLSWDFIKQ